MLVKSAPSYEFFAYAGLILLCLSGALKAEEAMTDSESPGIQWSVTPFIEYRVSEYVLEGPPSREPAFDLFSGTDRPSNGFRLFTNSRIPMYGISASGEKGNHRLSLSVASSLARIKEGNSADYDFYGHPWIKIRDNASQPLADFRDSNHVTTGAYNWSLSWSDLTRKEDRVDFQYSYFLKNSELTFGLHYAYWKDRFVDGPPFYVQHSRAFLQPDGRSLSLANNQYLLSALYQYKFVVTESFDVNAGLGLMGGWTTVTDYHPYRTLHVYSSTLGWGANLSLGVGYEFAKNHSLALSFTQERYYSAGELEARGGYSFEDRLMSLGGRQVYINYATRKWRLEYEIRF